MPGRSCRSSPCKFLRLLCMRNRIPSACIQRFGLLLSRTRTQPPPFCQVEERREDRNLRAMVLPNPRFPLWMWVETLFAKQMGAADSSHTNTGYRELSTKNLSPLVSVRSALLFGHWERKCAPRNVGAILAQEKNDAVFSTLAGIFVCVRRRGLA